LNDDLLTEIERKTKEIQEKDNEIYVLKSQLGIFAKINMLFSAFISYFTRYFQREW
jgi:hypothetical protein